MTTIDEISTDFFEIDDKYLFCETQKFDFTNPPFSAKMLYERLKKTMMKYKGIGLSANQVGIPYSVFVMGNPQRETDIIACFNPKIVYKSKDTSILEEACLSFPKVSTKVERSNEIRIRYTDYLGNVRTEVFKGMTARIVQHEVDHLQGKTILHGLSRLKIERFIAKANKYGHKFKIGDFKNDRHWEKHDIS